MPLSWYCCGAGGHNEEVLAVIKFVTQLVQDTSEVRCHPRQRALGPCRTGGLPCSGHGRLDPACKALPALAEMLVHLGLVQLARGSALITGG